MQGCVGEYEKVNASFRYALKCEVLIIRCGIAAAAVDDVAAVAAVATEFFGSRVVFA